MQAPLRKRVRYPVKRVRTGCLTCRRRKKKCDELHPECANCTRNKISCEWQISREAPSTSSSQAATEEVRSNPEHQRSWLPDTALSTPDQPRDFNNPSSSSPALSQTIGPFARTSLHDRQSSVYPRQLSVSSEVDSCEGADNLPAAPELGISQNCGDASSTNVEYRLDPQAFPSLQLLETSSTSPIYELLHHYIEVTAPQLAVYPCSREQNPFVELLLPVAFCSPLLLDSILALAAAHTTMADPRFFYGSAVSRLRTEVAAGRSATPVLLTTMTLCLYETAEGERRDVAITHLSGLVRMLHERHQTKTQTAHDNVVMEFLVYHCVTTGVFTNSASHILAPLLPGSDNEQFMGWDALKDFRPEWGVICGLSWDILLISLEISQLSGKLTTNGSLTTNELLRCLRLGQQLSDWTPPSSGALMTCMAQQSSYSMLSASARIWRVAVFLCLLMVMNNNSISPTNDLVVQATEEFTMSLSSLTRGLAAETCLNWPLVIVGSFTVQPKHREMVSERFASRRWLRFRNIRCAEEIVRACWSEYDKTGLLDVEKVMRREGLDIVLS